MTAIGRALAGAARFLAAALAALLAPAWPAPMPAPAGVLLPRTPRVPAPPPLMSRPRVIDPRRFTRMRVIALYHAADAPAQACLRQHGWPAYT